MSIFNREFSSNLGKQITWIIFLIIVSVMTMLAYPIITDPSVSPIIIDSFTKLPDQVTNVLFPYGLEVFDNIELYYSSQLIFNQFMICVFALNIGLMSLAKEQGFGTIDYLYINPVSRTEILVNKLLANFLNLLFLVIITFVTSTYIYSYVAELDFVSTLKDFAFVYAIIFVEGLLFLAFGSFVSSFFKRTASLGYVSTFVFIIVLALNLLLTLKILQTSSFVEGLVPLRPIKYIDQYSMNSLYMIEVLGKILPSIIFTILGALVYNNKDLTV